MRGNYMGYKTERVGNNGKTYVGANINNRQFEIKKPNIKNYIKNVKGGAQIVGGAIKKGIQKVSDAALGPTIRKMKIDDAKDKKMKQDLEMSKYGELAKRRKGRSTSDGRMLG